MGCDIHAFIEIQRDDGRWMLDIERVPELDRYYPTFGVLAGVRDRSVRPIAEPRGVPSDASQAYLDWVDVWIEDGHSHSWFTLEELEAAGVECLFGQPSWRRMFSLLRDSAECLAGDDPSRVRLAFFFDN